jgi:ABC-type polysaccharide/polyol phosphate export permease
VASVLASSSNRRLIDVVRVLYARTLTVRYRGSVLGIAWSAANPLAMAAVYTAIFGHTFVAYYDGSLLRYGIAVYIGLALAAFFIGGTTQALPSIVQSAELLNKIHVPFAAFPLSTLAAWAFQQVIATLPLVIVISLFINHSILHVLGLIVPLAGLAMLAIGVGMFVSGAQVYFRDVAYIYELATFLIWVTSPIFYPAGIVPASVLRLLAFNPLFPILESVRTLVLTDTWPSAQLYALSFIDGALALAIGVAAFRAMRPQFMDLL